MSDGAQRLVVNCGGPGPLPSLLPSDLAQALRSTAAHSTLVLADTNSTALLGDGTLGWRDYAPYDGIVVGAASPDVPLPYAEQLAEGGRLVIPIGTRDEQMLCVFTKRNGALERRDVGPVRFVPLLGAHGWQS